MQFWKVTLTFALPRTKAATFVSRGWALVKGHGLHEAFTTRNFTVNLVGQIPQETDTVLHQLPDDLKRKRKKGDDMIKDGDRGRQVFCFHEILMEPQIKICHLTEVNRYLIVHIFAVDLWLDDVH